MASTITLQTTVNLAATHAELVPLTGVGGFTNEPAISLCNDVLAELLAAPLDWKFNRAAMNMLATSFNRQDYLFAGATLFCIASAQSAGIDLATNNALTISGATVTIKTLEQYNGAIGDVCSISGTGSNYDSVLTQNSITSSWGGKQYAIATINGLTLTATVSGGTPSGTSGAPGITDFSWLVEASMWGFYSTAPLLPTKHLEAVRMLPVDGTSTSPTKIAVINDNNAGVLTIRFWHVPGSVLWGVYPIYQKQPPLNTSLTATWAPFPDHLGHVIRQAFLSRCYRFIESPRAEVEQQKTDALIAKTLMAGDREASDRHLYPEEGLMTSPDNWWLV